MHKKTIINKGALLILIWMIFQSPANADNLLLKVDEHNWRVDPERLGWVESYEKWYWREWEVALPDDEYDESQVIPLLNQKKISGIDGKKASDYLERKIKAQVEREKRDVVIDQDENGKIAFEGFALEGRKLKMDQAVQLIQAAFKVHSDEVHLPIQKIAPLIEVKSPILKEKGIKELVSTGETSFKGSPANRINNIQVGIGRFNGVLIPPQAEFILGDTLGPVDASTGYKKELVITGDKTVPEYGGGLCQVSTTIYRGALWAGLEITKRKNHSYAVSYYDPQGLDATIYPPTVDLYFINNSDHYLLMQTMTTEDGKAYVNYYGSKDGRKVTLMGPHYYNNVGAPPPRTEYTDKLAPGEKEKLGEAHPGFQASWYRQVSFSETGKAPLKEHIFSSYQARPLYYLVGGKEPEKKRISENGT